MADAKAPVVIKKITINQGGGHGGAWKVAFADFMTAMMAFFLCMWLLGLQPDQKKAISDYFSTPSVIEYNFSNYGVELTLEKLFLDLVNEPLKVLQDFMQPMDYSPNFLAMGSKNIVMSQLSEELGDVASGFEVSGDKIEMKFPESKLFEDGSPATKAKFTEIIGRLSKFTAGLEDADVYIDSRVYINSVKGQSEALAKQVAEKRLDLVIGQLNVKLEHQTVAIHGRPEAKPGQRRDDGRPEEGYIKVEIKQRDSRSDGTKPRKMKKLGGGDDKMDVYNNFVHKMTTDPKAPIKPGSGH